MSRRLQNFVLPLVLFSLMATHSASGQTWTADNGNGTYTNPLFYDEFSDPDMIRVGSDYYLTGTTMHTMPGLPILHSKDLINWEFLGYAVDRLDLGPEYRLQGGKDIYGQGIWAPSFRYHNGTFYIFSNVNGRTTQVFQAQNPVGPWKHTEMKVSLHDLSVLFDDDGKVYVIWGYQTLKLAQLNSDLTDVIPGSETTLFKANDGMGEGSHFYKFKGKYYITSAWFAGRMRMPCARADKPEGPYEVNQAISADEDFGLSQGNRLVSTNPSQPFELAKTDPNRGGAMSLHQGGVIDTSNGQWWGFSMMDYNSIGRLLSISPVTWQGNWPMFGLPGNLGRTPRTWVKPDAEFKSAPSAPYERSDDFSGSKLKPIWQWNHVPEDSAWSLTEHPGSLRLHSLPATNFWEARNTLTQRAIGPESTPTVELDASGLKPGDTAGLALLNYPYAWVGVSRQVGGLAVQVFNQFSGETMRVPVTSNRVWLRVHCNFLTEKATFSYSENGTTYKPLGGEFTMVFQLRTFQGIRYSLFNYSTSGEAGGYVDFDRFTVDELHPHGLMKPIPFGKTVTFSSIADGAALSFPGGAGSANQFKVVDRGLGRVALQVGNRFVTVVGDGAKGEVILKTEEPQDRETLQQAETFQWIETPYGDITLMSLATHRHLKLQLGTGAVSADNPGPQPGGKDGSSFNWAEVAPQ